MHAKGNDHFRIYMLLNKQTNKKTNAIFANPL